MKYPPKVYAKALAETISRSLKTEEKNVIVKSFLNLVIKNGDASKLQKIAGLTEELLLERTGRRKITVESARPLKKLQAGLIEKISGETDVIESKIEPSLVAGIRVTINKNLEWDGSLQKKLSKLFE